MPGSEAFDINERGQVVGASCAQFGCPALLWEPNGTIVPLEDLPGGAVFGTALAINDRAEIVGSTSDADVGHGAASWQGGTVESLGHDRTALDINDRGQIVGDSQAGVQRAVTWQQHEFAALPLPVGKFSAVATGINERAEIVGWSSPPPPGFELHGTLWQEGRATDLNDLIACDALPPTIVLGIAFDINERGRIVVNATDTAAASGSQQRAFLLTPVSAREPCN